MAETVAQDGAVTDQQREIVQRYGNLKQEVQDLYAKVAEIDADKSEHELVLSQLNGLNSDRRCWHQVGEVLVETTVHAVVPVLATKHKNIEEAIASLSARVREKEAELEDLRKTYNIREQPGRT